jgi:hypothetical protein
MSRSKEWLWVAVNQASAMLGLWSMAEPHAHPTPEQFLGFRTLVEANKVTFPRLLNQGKAEEVEEVNQ